MASRVAIIGSDLTAAQTALTLAELGAEVTVITSTMALGLDSTIGTSTPSSQDMLRVWPLLLRASGHPRVKLYTNSRVKTVVKKRKEFALKVTREPRYVRRDLCTGCGSCEESCSVKVLSLLDGRRVSHSAIHAPLLGAKATPSAYSIDKNGIAPCRVACPLGINVQGFVSLLSKGKVDQALSLINEVAPLAGVLGRVCTHPCEENCKRGEVDSPVFIRALHRQAADDTLEGINYNRKARAGCRKEKIAIVGSGPAGLAAAWELARRGYSPTIFESHAMAGGMLASGIPRFRLPREVREQEVEAIKALGVDIKTGITIGRDVTFTDLRERGYRSFFLAIGAQQNNKMNIPGEDLDGVADGISLLFALNVKVGASVGANVVVIGGGNSAVDSARTAKRRNRKAVHILYRRTAEEMTAIKEDVKEALKEGVTIDYLTIPVEILGDGTKVMGIRCQRMEPGEMEADGRRRPVPIPGSEFVMDADHVVVAIGQHPNTSLLNVKTLDINGSDATINVDPLTLETNIPGVFAGGDCVTGPNNVVEAMAAGLRAAESIDRYLRRWNLREGRFLEKPQPAEVDINKRDISPDKRARMPLIHYSSRMGSFEETNRGLSTDVARREAGRCLNCALCSECRECERVCELGAVFHSDGPEEVTIDTDIIINLISTDGDSVESLPEYGTDRSNVPVVAGPGIYTMPIKKHGGLWSELSQASAVALKASVELGLREEVQVSATGNLDVHHDYSRPSTELVGSEETRIGVVLCRCGGSNNSVINFEEVAKEIRRLDGVCNVEEVSQVCSKEGAWQLGNQATRWGLRQMVVAACRCCNLDQICFSCTDRRVMCQHYVRHGLTIPYGIDVQFANIREQCAWVHTDDPAGATRKAMGIISAGVARAHESVPAVYEECPVNGSVLVIGAGLYGLAAATNLAAQGYSVAIVDGPGGEQVQRSSLPEYQEKRADLMEQLREQGILIRPCPESLELEGSPGSYEVVLRYRSQTSRIRAGTVILDLVEINGGVSGMVDNVFNQGFLGRILARAHSSGRAGADSVALRGLTIKETAGIFIILPEEDELPEEQVVKGAATAARASIYLQQGSLNPRATAINIDVKLCRGCGDCAALCPYIEMRECGDGMTRAHIDRALCLGCGACIVCCPTGAITQSLQSDRQLTSILEALLGSAPGISEAG